MYVRYFELFTVHNIFCPNHRQLNHTLSYRNVHHPIVVLSCSHSSDDKAPAAAAVAHSQVTVRSHITLGRTWTIIQPHKITKVSTPTHESLTLQVHGTRWSSQFSAALSCLTTSLAMSTLMTIQVAEKLNSRPNNNSMYSMLHLMACKACISYSNHRSKKSKRA